MKWVYLRKSRDRRAVRLYRRRWQAGPRRHRCRLRHKNATSPRPTSSCVSMSTKASGEPIPLDAQDGGYRRAFVGFVFVAGMSFDARRPLNPNGGRTKKAHTSVPLAKVTRSPYRCQIDGGRSSFPLSLGCQSRHAVDVCVRAGRDRRGHVATAVRSSFGCALVDWCQTRVIFTGSRSPRWLHNRSLTGGLL